VADRLALLHRAAADVQVARLTADGAGASAVGAGLLVAEALGVLLQEAGAGALDQPLSGGAGQLLHGGQIDLEVGAVVAKGLTGNDFTPAGSQFADFVEILGCEVGARHWLSCLVLGETGWGALPLPLYRQAPVAAKQVLTSCQFGCRLLTLIPGGGL
jgi:hypothetical protein